MTVALVDPAKFPARLVGNGVTTVFPFQYKILAKVDIRVYVAGALKVVDVDYTVAGFNSDSGGAVTFFTAPANGANVIILRAIAQRRTTDYQQLGDFLSTTVNPDFDNAVLLIQDLYEQLARCLQIPVTTTPAVDPTIVAANYANKYLAFDAHGNPTPALLSATAMTQSIIGQLYRPAIAAEATVTIVNYFQEYADPRRYGAACNGVTDDHLALIAADTVAAAYGVSIAAKGVMHIGTATTINSPIADTLSQIFSTTSQITLAGTPFVRPEWFGAGQNTVRMAVAALPITGGVIQLEDKVYQTNNYYYGFAGAANCMDKDGVTFKGKKMPWLTSDCKALTGGTIIQGLFCAYANNVAFENLGVDHGYTISQTLHGGEAAAGYCDALVLTYPNDAIKASAALRLGARLHNVIGLAYGPNTQGHGVIIGEGFKNVSCTGEIVGCYGTHGTVIKCAGVRAEQITAFCNNSDGLIIKSDSQATAISSDIQIGRVYVNATGPIGHAPYAISTTGFGVLLNPAGNSISRIQIGQIESFEHPICFGTAYGGNYSIDDVQIGSITTDQITLGGVRQAVQILAGAGQGVRRIRIGSISARNTSLGFQGQWLQIGTLEDLVNIGRISVVNAVNAIQLSSQAYVSIDTVEAINCSDAVYEIFNTPKLTVGSLMKSSNIPAFYSTSGGGLAPALTNSWTQVAANDVFGVDLLGGKVSLRGLIKPGTTNGAASLPTFLRPSTNKRFMVQGYNGATVVAVPLVVDTAGNVVVNEVAGGTANCSTWLSLSGVTYDSQA